MRLWDQNVVRRDCLDQPGVSIGGHRPHPGTTTEFHEAVVSLVATTARIDKFNSFALRRF